MKELTSLKQCEQAIQKFSLAAEKNILMIDGQTLEICMSSKGMEEMFFQSATMAPSVCVCRCSPT
jgi:phospholipid-translocating ATPase